MQGVKKKLLFAGLMVSGIILAGRGLLIHATGWSIAHLQGDYIEPAWRVVTITGMSGASANVKATYLPSLIAGLILSCFTLAGILFYWRITKTRESIDLSDDSRQSGGS